MFRKKIIALTLLLLFLRPFNSSSQIVYHDSIAPKFSLAGCVNCKSKELGHSKHLLLEFWASWCKGCLTTIPHINHLARKYKNDIAFISINSYDSLNIIEHLVNEKNIQTLVIHDQYKTIQNSFKITLLPICILIDNQGKLRWRGTPKSLTMKLLDEFIKRDTIILEDFNKYKIQGEFEIIKDKFNLKYYLQSSIHEYKDEFISKSKISFNFNKLIEISATNYPSTKVLEFLLNIKNDYQIPIKVNVFFIKNIDFNISFIDGKYNNTILNNAINKLMNIYKLDTIVTKENIEYYELIPSRDIRNFESKNNNDSKYIKQNVDDSILMRNYKLYDLAKVISDLLDTKVLFLGSSEKKYDFNLSNISDKESVKSELYSTYGLQLKLKQDYFKVIEIIDRQ